MRDPDRLSIAGAAISCLLSFPADGAEVLQYSVEPLNQKPLMTRAEVAVDVAGFNNWLVENHASLTKEKLPGPREHAYLLIDSILKDRQAEGRTDFNEFEVFTPRTLFNWGSHLGVYGSGLVARYLAKVTFLEDTTGCFALAYLGIDGTFQPNRVSYVDLIESLNRVAADPLMETTDSTTGSRR